MKIVLDTNVVLDWFVFRNPGVAPVAAAIEEGRVRWVGSPETLDELRHVLRHAPLAGRELEIERVLTSAVSLMQPLIPVGPLPQTRWRCSDPSDQKFIDLAMATQSCWLLTRDRAVLKLARKVAPSGLLIQVPERWQLGAPALPPA